MKNNTVVIFAVLALVVLLSGCGLQSQVDDLKDKARKEDDAIAALQKQIASLVTSLTNNIAAMDSLETKYNGLSAQLNSAVSAQQAGDITLQSQIDSLNDQLETTITTQATLQSVVVNQTTQLVQLEMNQTISGFVDPCGPSGGYDEVLMRTSNGTLVAYFEDGNGNRHLSTLPAGSYRTTDAQQCYFSVDATGHVCDNTVGCQ